jgi:hypothetical protein
LALPEKDWPHNQPTHIDFSIANGPSHLDVEDLPTAVKNRQIEKRWQMPSWWWSSGITGQIVDPRQMI